MSESIHAPSYLRSLNDPQCNLIADMIDKQVSANLFRIESIQEYEKQIQALQAENLRLREKNTELKAVCDLSISAYVKTPLADKQMVAILRAMFDEALKGGDE